MCQALVAVCLLSVSDVDWAHSFSVFILFKQNEMKNTSTEVTTRDPKILRFIYSLQRRLNNHGKLMFWYLDISKVSSTPGQTRRYKSHGESKAGRKDNLYCFRGCRWPLSNPSHLLSILSHPYLRSSGDRTPYPFFSLIPSISCFHLGLWSPKTTGRD